MEPLISEEDKREIKSMGAELEMIPLDRLQELEAGTFCWVINFRENQNPTPEQMERARIILEKIMNRFKKILIPRPEDILKEIQSYRFPAPANRDPRAESPGR